MAAPKAPFVVYVIFVSSLVFSLVTFPGKSLSDISEPADDGAEDLAGLVLIGSNVALGGYLGNRLAGDGASSGMSYLGVGFGLGSIALGVSEETSFSGGIIVAGSVVAALGLMNLVSNNDKGTSPSEENYTQQGSLIAPYLAGTNDGERGVGVLVRMLF